MRQSLNQPKRKRTTLVGNGFVTKTSLARSEKKREIYKLILAQSDIWDACKTCEHFLTVIGPHAAKNSGPYAGMNHPLYYPLLEAIVISYARPFTQNNGLGQLVKKWGGFTNRRHKEAHEKIIRSRNELVAHSDPFVRKVKIEPPGVRKLGDIQSSEIGFSIRGYWFTIMEVEVFHDTARDLAARLLEEVEKNLTSLYGGMDLPAKAFDLQLSKLFRNVPILTQERMSPC